MSLQKLIERLGSMAMPAFDPHAAPLEGWAVELAREIFAKRWKAAIIFHLATGDSRFGDLARCLSRVSHKVLTQQLRELERDGLVTRATLNARPRYSLYSLSAFGVGLAAVLRGLEEWGTHYHHSFPHTAPRYGLAMVVPQLASDDHARARDVGLPIGKLPRGA